MSKSVSLKHLPAAKAPPPGLDPIPGDHDVAILLVCESTPGGAPTEVVERLRDARMLSDRTYQVWGDPDQLRAVVRAMDDCVERVELGLSAVAAPTCHDPACLAYDHDINVSLDRAARSLERQVEEMEEDVDHDGDDDFDDGDLADCAPEYPRNDAGEWLGRM